MFGGNPEPITSLKILHIRDIKWNNGNFKVDLKESGARK